MSKEILTTKDAAIYMNTSEPNVRKLLREGKITGVKAGKEWRIPKEELNKFLGIKDLEEDFAKDMYIKELEGKLKKYQIQLAGVKGMILTLKNLVNN